MATTINKAGCFLLMTVLVTALFASSRTVRAASLTVNSLADTIATDGGCTLREAIQNANNNAATNADCAAGSGADTITFSVSGTLTLGSGLPGIADKAGLTVDGAGQTVTVDGNHTVHMIAVIGLVPLTLHHLTIANGAPSVLGTYGGAIENYGSLTITDSTFTGNHNTAYHGGAIYNQSATLSIDNTNFSDNNSARNGGGIYSLAGVVTITNSTFTSNTAANGGAIYCYGCTLNVTDSTFSNNNAPNGIGGGIYVFEGPLTITGSIFSGNGASYGSGGGVYYKASSLNAATIARSSFANNSATGSPGGAIFNQGTMNISTSTFTGNSAGDGGAIYYTESSSSSIANSTFSGNSASGTGGGVFFSREYTGDLTITNSTFSGNSAAGSGGGIKNSSESDGTLTLRNTIVVNSPGGNCSGVITNGASNLEDGATCGWETARGSMSGVDPLLGALTGAPAYFPLGAASPAIDRGDDSICAAAPVSHQSQNSITRPQGAHCDIGSFEFSFIEIYIPLVRK